MLPLDEPQKSTSQHQSTSVAAQESFVPVLSRTRPRCQTLPELVVAKGGVQSTRQLERSTRQENQARSASDESAGKYPRNAASSISSSSSGSLTRRLSRSEQNRYATKSTDTLLRRQTNPLKVRQRKKLMSSEDPPPTPSSAYFPTSTSTMNRRGKEENSASRSVSLSSTSTSLNSTGGHEQYSSIDTPSSSALYTEDTSFDDSIDGVAALSMSLSSDVDTPSPFTPATPAWKPRELTLLKKNADLPQDTAGRGRDRDDRLVGLGLHSPAPPHFPTESNDRPPRGARLLAKDILPIAKVSTIAGSSKELNSTSAGGPSDSRRAKVSTSPQLLSSSQAPEGSLPSPPPGTSFPSGTKPAISNGDEAPIPLSNANSSGQNFAALYTALDEESTRLARLTNEGDSRKTSFSLRAESASAGSRRKGPPTALNLGSSTASSYLPTSSEASASRTSKATAHISPHAERVGQSLLTVPQGRQAARVAGSSESTIDSSVTQSFHTPMQSPTKPRKTSLRAILSSDQVQKMEASDGEVNASPVVTAAEDKDREMQAEAIPVALMASSYGEIAEVHTLPSKAEGVIERQQKASLSSKVSSDINTTHMEVARALDDPGMSFKTNIFNAGIQEQGLVSQGWPGKSEDMNDDMFAANMSPMGSPDMRDPSFSSTSAAMEQRSRSDPPQQQQHEPQLPRSPPPGLPSRVLPTLLVKSPSNDGTLAALLQYDNADSYPRESSDVSIYAAGNSTIPTPSSSTSPYFDKPVPPLPKPKLSLVPDVPSFGYTGPINSRSNEALGVSSPFPPTDYTAFHEENIEVSRWSSGSDSDGDEKSSIKSANRKNFKQRKSSGSVSGQSARKMSVSAASGSTSASTAARKTGFFAGLGRRKKSTPTLSAQASPTMMFTSSPASARLDHLAEYPFPVGSPASFSKQSFSTNDSSRRGSNAQFLQSALTTASSDGPSYGALHSPLAKAFISSPMDISSQVSRMQTTEVHEKFTSPAPSRSNPPTAAQPTIVKQAQVNSQDYQSGLGIQMPPGEDPARDTPLQDVSRTLQNVSSERVRDKSWRSSWRKSMSFPSKEQGDTEALQSRSLFGLRKKAVPGSTEQRSSWRRSQSGPSSPSREVVPSSSKSRLSFQSSADETPRLPFASLNFQRESHALEEEEEASFNSLNGEKVDTDNGTEVKSQDGNRMTWQATPTSAAPSLGHPKQSPIHTRRLRVEETSTKPRYTSLTDVGRLWRDEHPDLAFGGAQGLDLLCLALSGGQHTSGGINGGSFGSGESDSGTDDYGSSEGGAGGQGSGNGANGNHGDGNNQGDDDKPSERKDAKESDGEGSTSSSDSEDSYGNSDHEEGPAVSTARDGADSSSGSSDDIPLGQRVRNPQCLQRQLRQMARRTRRGREMPSVAAGRAEVSSSDLHFVLDANDLAVRLARVLVQQESSQAPSTDGAAPLPSSAAVSRNRSIIARKPAASSHKVPDMPSRASQEVSRLQSKIAVAPIQTSNLFSASRMQGKSSPISPHFRPSQPMSSGTVHTESSDASMKTALEAQPSSSVSQQEEDHRAAVIADFAKTIKARSRSRSFAHTFSPSQDSSRPPPIPSRSVLVPQLNNVPPLALATGKGEKVVEKEDTSPSSSSIASPKPRNVSYGFKASPTSAADENETAGRVRQPAHPNAMVQHRVYLINKQRCGTAEVEMNARVRDVVHSVMEREPMPPDSRSGGWVLFDVCADLGVERPLREYELISEIIALRSNAQRDYFIFKRTELSPYLSIKNVPNSSAALAGWLYVQENHKKKWNKRWLELRDNCLYAAKTEKGKDDSLLCSLSSFDLYLTDTTAVKTPKQYSFALRSQNFINMFESPEADYIHYFSLSDAGASRHWITAILNARTFVLRQEKSHLFRITPTQVFDTAPPTATVTAMAVGSANNDQALKSTNRKKATQRLEATNSSPLEAPAAGMTTTTSPLLTFSQPSYPKGSLMEERFVSSRVATNEEMDRRRKEEVQMAERRGRKEGKPLLGVISDVTASTAAARPVNGLGGSSANNRV